MSTAAVNELPFDGMNEVEWNVAQTSSLLQTSAKLTGQSVIVVQLSTLCRSQLLTHCLVTSSTHFGPSFSRSFVIFRFLLPLPFFQ